MFGNVHGLENFYQICDNKYMKREHGVSEMKEFRILKTLTTQGIEPNGGGGALSSNVSKLGRIYVTFPSHLKKHVIARTNAVRTSQSQSR